MMIITEKVPHIVEMRLEMAVWQQLICNRIGWSEQNYCDFQLVAGSAFIDHVLHQSEYTDKQILMYSKVYWGWWANQWHSRNLKLYAQRMLDTNRYRRAHTTDVQSDSFIINNFWGHVETMTKDGSERLYREVVK